MKKLRNIGGFFVGIYFIISILAMILFNNSIEETSRQEARYIANGIGQCINNRVGTGIHTQLELSNISYECGASHRSGGPTGDFFVVDLLTNKFIYDGSPDCSKDGYNRHLTDEEECSLHKNPELCKDVIKVLKSGSNSIVSQNTYWEFDNAREWLEWVIIPNERKGFGGPIGNGGIKDNNNNQQLLIVMGTQSDEVNNQWSYTKILFILSLFIGVILTLFSYLLINNEGNN